MMFFDDVPSDGHYSNKYHIDPKYSLSINFRHHRETMAKKLSGLISILVL